jgi:hypothetical protein
MMKIKGIVPKGHIYSLKMGMIYLCNFSNAKNDSMLLVWASPRTGMSFP